jgi:PAS domain S-box-containing protein
MMEELQQTAIDQAKLLARKKQQIKDNQARYYRLLNAIHEVYYSADTDGNITEISPSIGTVAGYDCQEIIGRSATFFYRHPQDRQTFLHKLQQHYFVTDYELELLHKDGHIIHVSANAHMMFDDQKNLIGVEGMLRDITDRVALEEQLKQLNDELELRVVERTAELEAQTRQLQQFLQAIEQSAEAFIITDRSGKVEYVNPAFETINGYSPEEVKGHTLALINSGKHGSDFFHAIWSTLRSGQVWEGTIINRRKDGSEYPALMTIVPILHDGEIEFYAAIQQDMSEYEKLEAQFRQAQKMEALGTMVGGIAHDFNNMLAGLLMHIYLVKKHIHNPDLALEKLEMAEQLGYQAAKMLKDMLIFSRDDQGEKTSLNLNTMLKDSMRMLRVSIPEHIGLNLDVCDQDLSVMCDVTQFQQVMMNLLNNARDAMGEQSDGKIYVRLEHFIPGQDFADNHPDFHHESMAKLSIGDNGSGMPQDVLAKVFDPFFTTKAAGHGTGLGLSMVFGCIQNHGGVIEVESEPGAGTSFHIYLPLIEQVAPIDVRENDGVVHGDGELILIADDNEMICKLLVETLESLNYRTLSATDGVEALRLFDENSGQIRLAILDMVMPKLSGHEVGRRIRQSTPELPLMFATGHSEEESVRQDMGIFENSVLIEKPFKLKSMASGIRALLR